MKYRMWVGIVAAIAVSTALHAGGADKLVYADFEKVENGRPVSARGGRVDLWGYEEDHVHKSTYKGAEGVDPPAPQIVRIKPDDPNHAMKFDYSLQVPNPYAGVAVEIHGLPDADGKPQSEDVSGYKFLSLDVYATGIRIMKVEMRNNTSGKDTRGAYPEKPFEVKPGLNTYRLNLSGFTQPAWDNIRVDPKDVFKKLTSIAIYAFCEQCDQPKQGMVIVDNVVFEK